MSWPKDITKTYGFKIKTRRLGIYPIKIHIFGDLIVGAIEGLTAIVESEPMTRIHCIDSSHQAHDCAVGINPLQHCNSDLVVFVNILATNKGRSSGRILSLFQPPITLGNAAAAQVRLI